MSVLLLAPLDSLVLGVDIGGTKIAAGLVDADGVVVARASIRTPAELGPEAVVSTVVQLAVQVLAAAGDRAVLGCGVGSAGVIEPLTGRVLSATSALPGWVGTPLAATLASRLGMPVTVLNDVHAHAAGESLLGAGRGAETVLVLAAGTGIGGAVVVGGRVQTGSRGVSGHFGHLPSIEAAELACTCGRRGHVEAVASGPAILSRYVELAGAGAGAGAGGGAGGVARDAQAVFALADTGDALAASVIDTAGFALGRTLGGLGNALDPDVVVIGGGLSSAGERWWSALRRGFANDVLPLLADCRIVPAALGADAALVGAAALFRNGHPVPSFESVGL